MSDLIGFQKNNLLGVKYPSFDGLTYINTYSVEAFKLLVNLKHYISRCCPMLISYFLPMAAI